MFEPNSRLCYYTERQNTALTWKTWSFIGETNATSSPLSKYWGGHAPHPLRNRRPWWQRQATGDRLCVAVASSSGNVHLAVWRRKYRSGVQRRGNIGNIARMRVCMINENISCKLSLRTFIRTSNTHRIEQLQWLYEWLTNWHNRLSQSVQTSGVNSENVHFVSVNEESGSDGRLLVDSDKQDECVNLELRVIVRAISQLAGDVLEVLQWLQWVNHDDDSITS